MAPGFAHGFLVLSETADLHYKVSRFYDHADEGGVRWDDPDVGIRWPAGRTSVAPRDAAFPTLRQLSPGALSSGSAAGAPMSGVIKPTWDGVFASFAEAGGEAAVFESPLWMEKIVARARAARDGAREPGAIAPVALTTDYTLVSFAAALAKRSEPLRILDSAAVWPRRTCPFAR